MPATWLPLSSEPSERAWKILGRIVKARREFLGWSQDDVSDHGGPRKTTVSKIERAAERAYSSRTQQQMEKALGWDRGAIGDLLIQADREYATDEWVANIELELLTRPGDVEVVEDPPGLSPYQATARLTDEQLLAELAHRMRRSARVEGGTSDEAPAAQKMNDDRFAGTEEWSQEQLIEAYEDWKRQRNHELGATVMSHESGEGPSSEAS